MRHHILHQQTSTGCPDTSFINQNTKNKSTIKKLNIKLKVENKEIRVILNLSIATKTITLTIDTGAQLSLLKSDIIHPKTIYFPDRKAQLIGISGIEHKVETLGLAYGSFKINNIDVQHQFQIYDTKHKIVNTDGILGLDFLEKYAANIDLFEETLTIVLPPSHKIYEPKEIDQSNSENEYTNISDRNNEDDQLTKEILQKGLNLNQTEFETRDQKTKHEDIISTEELDNILGRYEKLKDRKKESDCNSCEKLEKELNKSLITLSQWESKVHKLREQNEELEKLKKFISKKQSVENVEMIKFDTMKKKNTNNNTKSRKEERKENLKIKLREEPTQKKETIIKLIKTLDDERPGGQIIEGKTKAILKIQVPVNEELLCINTEILPGVKIANSLIKGNKGEAYIGVFNENTLPIKIFEKDLKLKFEELTSYNIFKLDDGKQKQERIQYIKAKINTEGCTEEEVNHIFRICEEFSEVFYVENDTLSQVDVIEHKIKLKNGTKPISARQYRIPESQKEELRKMIKEMERQGIIEPSNSSFNAPLLLIPKKNGPDGAKNFRLVLDYRLLNNACEIQDFPIPLVKEAIENLNGAKYFTTLDLYGAFYQIPLDPESRDYTSFTDTQFKWRFARMPQGLSGSPLTFQKMINTIFRDMLGPKVSIYLDDLLLASNTLNEHIELIREVMHRLKQNNLKLKLEKTLFFKKSVYYLGFKIDQFGTYPDERKTEIIKNYKRPENIKELQRFLGCSNYYRQYIRNYAKITKPLYILCKKDIPFLWNEGCQKAFNTLKLALTSEPVLIHANFNNTFYICTDGSTTSVGAVLFQLHDDQIGEKPIQYASKLLTKEQSRWPAIEIELYAIIFAVENFRHYIYGRSFIIRTDSKPLTYLLNHKKPSSRLHRWRILLMDYSFQIQYIKGKENIVADFLSRMNPPEQMEIENAMPHINTFNILPVATRNSSKVMQKLGNSQTSNTENLDNNYHIEECNNILIDPKNVDHIFYIFTSEKCEMRNKLEHKLKCVLHFEKELLPYQPYKISKYRTCYILPNIIRNTEQLTKTRLVLESILKLSLDNNYEDIAINIDIQDPESYFKFKNCYKTIFDRSNIKTYFYLNKIMEITDIEHIKNILNTYHKSLLAGHTGIDRMKNAIRKYYNWPTMTRDIKNYIKACPVCEKIKINKHTKCPMQISKSNAEYPFQSIYIDHQGPNIKTQNDNVYIFTAICQLTSYAIAVPLPDCTALTTAKALVDNVILKYNLPTELISDNSTTFTSDLLKEITKLLKIKKIYTVPYNPKANRVERFHKTLNTYLKAFVSSEPENWDKYLNYALFSYNNMPMGSGFSPNQLLFGYDIKLPDKITKNTDPIYNHENYVNELRYRLKHSQDLARNLEKSEKFRIKNIMIKQ